MTVDLTVILSLGGRRWLAGCGADCRMPRRVCL